jgi:hypothetical protein
MSLSGSLSDFEISDIFHIISQERKTGKLIISTDDIEGYIVFKQGEIIFAETNQQNLRSMLLKYLFYVKDCPENKINELNILCRDNFQLLLKELLKKYYTPKEQAIIVETGIEDIVCSFFLLKQGNFRFEPVSNVNFFLFESFAISTDSITMEAAKRIDDWERINKCIGKDSVFVRSETSKLNIRTNGANSALDNFPEYLCTILDGTSSTEFLCQESFFSKYQIYLALYELLLDNKIIPLPEDISNSVNAALQRPDKPVEPHRSKIVISTVSTIVIVIVIYLLGHFMLHEIIFSTSNAERDLYRSEIIQTQANRKVAIATLQYQANFGTPPLLLNKLFKAKFLEKRDFSNFYLSTDTDNEKEESSD